MSLIYESLRAAMGRWFNGAESFGFGAIVAQTGPGVYTITLDSPLSSTECVGKVQMEDAGIAKFVHTSTTVKTVTTFLAADLGNAANANWEYEIAQAPNA